MAPQKTSTSTLEGCSVRSVASTTSADMMSKSTPTEYLSAFDLSTDVLDKLSKISDFAAQYRALRSLQESTSENGPNVSWKNRSPSKSTNDAIQNYSKVLREFQESQIQSLAASLFNMEEETLDDLEGKRNALKNALETETSLSNNMLQAWYDMLSGKRPKGTLESNHLSCPVESIEAETGFLIQSLATMELGLVEHPARSSSRTLTMKAIAFALTAYVATETIKMNRNIYDSQLAQVVLTWALQRSGIPLIPHLYQTPSQKVEYIFAIEKTRRHICFAQNGSSGNLDWKEVLKQPGLLSPLVSVLLSRLCNAIDELGKLVVEKDQLATEEAEAKAVRRARELQASEGTCIICLDQSPNMATLCCGKTVHLNCIAEWLQAHSNCPQCRKDMPSLHIPNHNLVMSRPDDDSLDGDVVVGELLGYLANEATDDDNSSTSSSSSSSSDSSSSSSSSSTLSSSRDSLFSYSAFHYRIHYGSTDEEEHETIDADLGFEDMLNGPEVVSATDVRDEQGDHAGDESTTTPEPYGFPSTRIESSYQVTDPFVESDNDTSEVDIFSSLYGARLADDRSPLEEDDLSSTSEARPRGTTSRLSFLDSSLLTTVHYDDKRPGFPRTDLVNGDSAFADSTSQSSNTDGSEREHTSVAPLVPRHLMLPEHTTRSLARQLSTDPGIGVVGDPLPGESQILVPRRSVLDEETSETLARQVSGERQSATARAPWLIRDSFAFGSDGDDDSESSSAEGAFFYRIQRM